MVQRAVYVRRRTSLSRKCRLAGLSCAGSQSVLRPYATMLKMNVHTGTTSIIAWRFGDPERILEVAEEWDQLVSRNSCPAFLRAHYIRQAIAAFGCKYGLSVLGHAGDRLVAGGVLVPLGWGRWVSYQPSQLPLGAWVMDRDRDWPDLLSSLILALPGYAVSLSITQQDPLLVERPPSGPTVEVLDYVETGWIDVVGSFEDFWNARGKNLRQNLRKQRRRLEERGHRLSFDYLTEPPEVDAAFVEFASLESAGWKATEGTAITVGNTQGLFYRRLLVDHAASGEAFAWRFAVDGRPVAVDFGLRDAANIIVLKTTYDESLKAYSPAQLLHEQAFERVFREQLAWRIEFFGKMMDWHCRWTEKSRMLFHVNVYRSPWLRRLRDAAKCLDARYGSSGIAAAQD